MPRPVVKAAADVVQKWVRRASSAGTEYEQGVRSTPADWAASAAAAKQSWQTAVTEAAGRDAFAKGVQAAGNQKWRDRAITLGPARFAQGVGAAEPSYSAGIGPVLATIGAVDLPARGVTGSEGNYARSAAIGKALRAAKTGRR